MPFVTCYKCWREYYVCRQPKTRKIKGRKRFVCSKCDELDMRTKKAKGDDKDIIKTKIKTQ